MSSIFDAFQEDDYRLDDYQVRFYKSETRKDYPENLLGLIYEELKGDRYSMHRPGGTGILDVCFCGMGDLSYQSIVSYLANRPLVLLGIWEESTEGPDYRIHGFAFPTTITGTEYPDRMGFFGYAMFRSAWGQPWAATLGMLGLVAIFSEFRLSAIHGLRYDANELTARFMRQYGFKDNGTIPRYMLRAGKLVSVTASTLLREDFEQYTERAVLDAYKDTKSTDQPKIASQPAVSEPINQNVFDTIPRFR